jgi:hypothetical protein
MRRQYERTFPLRALCSCTRSLPNRTHTAHWWVSSFSTAVQATHVDCTQWVPISWHAYLSWREKNGIAKESRTQLNTWNLSTTMNKSHGSELLRDWKLLARLVFTTSQRKFVHVQAMKAYMGRRFIAPCIFNLGSRWSWVVNFTSGRLNPRQQPWYQLNLQVGDCTCIRRTEDPKSQSKQNFICV